MSVPVKGPTATHLAVPAPVAAPAAAPVGADERLHALDILRGFALFGMILVHFHQNMRIEVTGPEDLIAWGVYVLVEQKAWGTFAFLFGVGFAVLLRRLEARGAAVVPIYLRRLAALALFGLVAEVGFGFSVLLEYACWGVALLVIRRWSTRALLATAAVSAAARPMAAGLTALHAWWAGAPLPPAPAERALRQAVDLAAQQGHYATLLSARWALFLGGLPHGWRDLLPDVNLALFTLGLLAVRHGVLDEPKRHVRLIAGWMTFGALSWAVDWLGLGNVTTGVRGLDWPVRTGLGFVQDQWLCLAYIGAVVLLLAYRPAWTARLAPIGRAGRLALTTYMLQAAALDALASGYGAGLRLRPLVYAPAAGVFFTGIVLFSTWWLRRYRFGPLEWVWRTITYARRQPFRRAATGV